MLLPRTRVVRASCQGSSLVHRWSTYKPGQIQIPKLTGWLPGLENALSDHRLASWLLSLPEANYVRIIELKGVHPAQRRIILARSSRRWSGVHKGGLRPRPTTTVERHPWRGIIRNFVYYYYYFPPRARSNLVGVWGRRRPIGEINYSHRKMSRTMGKLRKLVLSLKSLLETS